MTTIDLAVERDAAAQEWTHFQHVLVAKRIAGMPKPSEDWFVKIEWAIICGAQLVRALGVRPADVI